MPSTVQNQKWFRIHRTSLRNNFLSVAHADWMGVNKNPKLGPYALQLYLYLAGNANGYEFGLSAEHAERAAGIRRTSFHKYLHELERQGYIVWQRGNVFDFYTSPRPENERTDSDHHENFISFEESSDEQNDVSQPADILSPTLEPATRTAADLTESASQTAYIAQQTQNPPNEQNDLHSKENCSPCDIEIYNKYSPDNEDKDSKDNAGETPAPPAPAAEAALATIGEATDSTLPDPIYNFEDCIDPVTGDYIF